MGHENNFSAIASGKTSFTLSLCNFTRICIIKRKMLCNFIVVDIIERNILKYHVQQMKLISIGHQILILNTHFVNNKHLGPHERFGGEKKAQRKSIFNDNFIMLSLNKIISYIGYELKYNHYSQNTKITMSNMVFMAMSFRCGLIVFCKEMEGCLHNRMNHTQFLWSFQNDKDLKLEIEMTCNHCTKFMF
jgi:hypothetical protein